MTRQSDREVKIPALPGLSPVRRFVDMRSWMKTLAGGAAAPVALVVAAVALVVMSVAYCLPLAATDTLCRYAPMAEAFADGDWANAFHPRFGVGGSVVAGLFSFLPGFDGFTACTVSSSLAWALCLLPVFRLADRVFDRRTAWFALAVFAVCPQPLVWALEGLREPFKMLGLLLMVDALVRVRDADGRTACAVEACLSLPFLCLFKCDSILLAIVLGLAYAVGDCFRSRTWVLAGCGIAVLQPMCWLVWTWTGYWLPAPHYVPLWQKLFGG